MMCTQIFATSTVILMCQCLCVTLTFYVLALLSLCK